MLTGLLWYFFEMSTSICKNKNKFNIRITVNTVQYIFFSKYAYINIDII